MSAKPKFTRIPKMRNLVEAGVPAEAIPTYCAITDYANNKTGLCWPRMETLAKTLGRSVRTVETPASYSRVHQGHYARARLSSYPPASFSITDQASIHGLPRR